jgi:hypothetical protein
MSITTHAITTHETGSSFAAFEMSQNKILGVEYDIDLFWHELLLT